MSIFSSHGLGVLIHNILPNPEQASQRAAVSWSVVFMAFALMETDFGPERRLGQVAKI